MYTRSRSRRTLTPLAQFMLEYVQKEGITLTELARRAGLSPGAVRSLVYQPERIPSLETCLRLSQVTAKPAIEIARLAGVDAPVDLEQYHPDRVELITIFDRLPMPLKRALVDVARALRQVAEEESHES